MGHATIRSVIIPEIVRKIMDSYHVDENTALRLFYRSSTGASLADDETGLYGQSPNFIFGLYEQEVSERSGQRMLADH